MTWVNLSVISVDLYCNISSPPIAVTTSLPTVKAAQIPRRYRVCRVGVGENEPGEGFARALLAAEPAVAGAPRTASRMRVFPAPLIPNRMLKPPVRRT